MTQTILLGDIIKVQNGYAFPSKVFVESGYPVVKIKNIDGARVNLEDAQCIGDDQFSALSDGFKLNTGDIVIAMTGAKVGKLGMVSKSVRTPVLNQRVGRLVAKGDSLDEYFAFILLSLPSFQAKILGDAAGSAQPNISSTALEAISIPSLEPDQRRRVTQIIKTIDEKIELNRQMNETLEQMGQALFRHYFIDNPEAEKWEEVALPGLIEFIGGSQPPKSEHIYEDKEGYVRFVQNRDYASDRHKAYIPIAKRNKLCNETDIMMDKYGEAGRVRFGIAGAYNVALAKIVFRKENMQEYLRAYFSMPQIQRSLESAAAASTRSSLNSATFAGFKVKMPTDDLLIDFENSHKNILHTIMANSEQIQTLTSLRDTLLPRLISGKVKV